MGEVTDADDRRDCRDQRRCRPCAGIPQREGAVRRYLPAQHARYRVGDRVCFGARHLREFAVPFSRGARSPGAKLTRETQDVGDDIARLGI
jgi:hypothetical protein